MLDCSICNKSTEELLQFNCSHSLCSDCVHLDLLFNYEELKDTQGVDNEIDLKCIICDEGHSKSTKESLKEILLKTPNGEVSEMNCKEHNLENKMFCITCSRSMCLSCFDIHEPNHLFTNDMNFKRKNCVKCKDYELLFHCMDCSIDCCYVCERIYHKDHQLSVIKDHYQKYKESVKSALFPTDNYEDFDNKLNFDETNMLDQFGVIRQTIKNNMEEIIKSLERSKEEIDSNFVEKEKEIKTFNVIVKNIFKKFYGGIVSVAPDDYKIYRLLSKLPEKFTSLNSNQKNTLLKEKYSEQMSEIFEKLKCLNIKINTINDHFKKNNLEEVKEEIKENNEYKQNSEEENEKVEV